MGVFLKALFVVALGIGSVQCQGGQSNDSLTVDLGYAKYRGEKNDTTGLNTWLGIKYAASPGGLSICQVPHSFAVILTLHNSVGKNRWSVPRTPDNTEGTTDATTMPPMCYQGFTGNATVSPYTGIGSANSMKLAKRQSPVVMSEDCLIVK